MTPAPSWDDAQEYLAKARASGYRNEEIAAALREAGWSEEQVRDLLQGTLPPAPPPGTGRMSTADLPYSRPRPWWRGCLWGCLGLFVLTAPLFALLFPVFTRARVKACQSNCLSNVKQLMLGSIMYASDNNDHFPPAADWPDRLYPYLKNAQIYACPNDDAPRRFSDQIPKLGYTLNMKANQLANSAIPRPAELVILFDGTQVYGGLESVAFRHNEGANTGFADGHAKWLARQTFTSNVLYQQGMPAAPLLGVPFTDG
ncbi:MAG TPA: H-X9-DG-CTERM domain-containing protein [Armatimonadota bacterium]|jgi:prepilin-type processing-associated H-X9-DG protein